jgi:hypothetical protein
VPAGTIAFDRVGIGPEASVEVAERFGIACLFLHT